VRSSPWDNGAMRQPDDELARDALSIWAYALYALTASAEVRFGNGPSVPYGGFTKRVSGEGVGFSPESENSKAVVLRSSV